jgi:hypothetical protein
MKCHPSLRKGSRNARRVRFLTLSFPVPMLALVQEDGYRTSKRAAWTARMSRPFDGCRPMSPVSQCRVGASLNKQFDNHDLSLDRRGVQRRRGPVAAGRLSIDLDAGVKQEAHGFGLAAHAGEHQRLLRRHGAIGRQWK